MFQLHMMSLVNLVTYGNRSPIDKIGKENTHITEWVLSNADIRHLDFNSTFRLLSASRRMRKMWVVVYLWFSFQCFFLCVFLGLYLFSIVCPVIYLLIFLSVFVSFCLFLIPSSEVVSVTFSVLPYSLPNPPPLLPKHLRVWQVREQQYPPGAPPYPFPHLFSPIVLPPLLLFNCADSHLPFPQQALSVPPLYSVNLFLFLPHFSLWLSPFTKTLFFSCITLHLPPNLCQVSPPPLSPLICSFPSRLTSSPIYDSSLPHLSLVPFFLQSSFICPLFLPSILT